jgi:hypothetical protein
VKSAQAPYELRPIGFGFARMKGPVLKEVKSLLEATGDSERRAVLALGLLRSDDSALGALGRRSCDHPALRSDPMCTEFFPRPGPDPDDPLAELYSDDTPKPGPDAGVDAVVAYFGPDDDEVSRRFGPAVFFTTLQRCARKGDDGAASCLRKLAGKNRPAAIAFLGLHGARLRAQDTEIGVVARTLGTYPDGGLHARLVSDGLLPATAPNTELEEVTAERMMLEADQIERFDVETGSFPNEHHLLLAKLAKRAGPVLQGVIFEERAPPEDKGPYVLRAYLGGKRFSLRAENNGDWYDTSAVMGLLNALLVHQKSPLRFVMVPTGDQTAAVLVGPLAALEALNTEGLLDVATSNEGMEDGKAFEERVFRALQGKGVEVIE